MLTPEVTERLSQFVSLEHLGEMPVGEARAVNDREAAVMFGPIEEVGSVRDEVVEGDLPVRIYEPTPPALGTLVYFHGGGWVVGSLDSHDGVVRHLCRHAGCTVVAVDYRLAPEHRYPDALEDAWTATSWAYRNLKRPLAIGGDSAGGNLAAVVARWARGREFQLAVQLLVYPVLDLTAEGKLSDYWWNGQYLGTNATAAGEADASPLLADDLAGLAPVFMQSCTLDPLRTQATRYEARLREAGVQVGHKVYPDLVHGAYRMPGVLPGARAMLDDSAAAVAHAIGLARV
jgi:acetyl esterase